MLFQMTPGLWGKLFPVALMHQKRISATVQIQSPPLLTTERDKSEIWQDPEFETSKQVAQAGKWTTSRRKTSIEQSKNSSSSGIPPAVSFCLPAKWGDLEKVKSYVETVGVDVKKRCWKRPRSRRKLDWPLLFHSFRLENKPNSVVSSSFKWQAEVSSMYLIAHRLDCSRNVEKLSSHPCFPSVHFEALSVAVAISQFGPPIAFV